MASCWGFKPSIVCRLVHLTTCRAKIAVCFSKHCQGCATTHSSPVCASNVREATATGRINREHCVEPLWRGKMRGNKRSTPFIASGGMGLHSGTFKQCPFGCFHRLKLLSQDRPQNTLRCMFGRVHVPSLSVPYRNLAGEPHQAHSPVAFWRTVSTRAKPLW